MTARLTHFIASNQENLISTFDLFPPAKAAVSHWGNQLMIQPHKSNIWFQEATGDILIVFGVTESRGKCSTCHSATELLWKDQETWSSVPGLLRPGLGLCGPAALCSISRGPPSFPGRGWPECSCCHSAHQGGGSKHWRTSTVGRRPHHINQRDMIQ